MRNFAHRIRSWLQPGPAHHCSDCGDGRFCNVCGKHGHWSECGLRYRELKEALLRFKRREYRGSICFCIEDPWQWPEGAGYGEHQPECATARAALAKLEEPGS